VFQIAIALGLAGFVLVAVTASVSRPRGPVIYDEPFKWKDSTYRLKIYDERDLPVGKMHWFVEHADGRKFLEGFSDSIEEAQAMALEKLAQRLG
jgi:hypothetical protein